MAERALPAGSSRRRVLFGALDADGWTWAGIRAFGWFLLLVLLLGYLPDRAYYFTVFPTLDIGANIASPINLCPPGNGDLPCPAPKGAVIPWQGNPAELSLPEGRADAVAVPAGTNLYLVGGTGPSGATSTVYQTAVTADGSFSPWTQAKALPAARTAAATVSVSGSIFLLGGADQSGAATDTVYEAVISNGALTDWKARDDLKLPMPLAGATVVAGTNSIWLIGGQKADQSYSRSVYRSVLDTTVNPPKFGPWQEQAALVLPAGRALALGAQVGHYLYVIGGQNEHGAQASVFRLQLDAAGNPAVDPSTREVLGWSASLAAQSLPRPRSDAAGYVSNGTIYIVGGSDAAGRPTGSFYWAIPDASGNFPNGWQQLQEDNLPANGPRTGAAGVVTSGHAFVIGGTGDSGPSVATFRADMAPASPFFALGLVGATIPALSIKGEVGQQLGYLDAAIVGGTDFALLILVGVAFSHRRATRRLLSHLTRGRVRPPTDDLYAD